MPDVGEIKLWLLAGDLPNNWYELNGGSIPAGCPLATLLGTTTLPDWSDRVPVQAGTMLALGAVSGAQNKTLSISEIPAHYHIEHAGSVICYLSGCTGVYGIEDDAFTNKSTATPVQTEPTGGGNSFSLLQPSVGVRYIIYAGFSEEESLLDKMDSIIEALETIAAYSATEGVIDLGSFRIWVKSGLVDSE